VGFAYNSKLVQTGNDFTINNSAESIFIPLKEHQNRLKRSVQK
jgi:hypothetical protein